MSKLGLEEQHALLDRAASAVTAWSPVRRRVHGFDLLVDADRVSDRRRAHARRILVGEAALDDLRRTTDGPLVLMKGLEVAQLYRAPTHRPFRDLDVLMPDPEPMWQRLRDQGYRQNPRRRSDIDHHHLPSLASPHGLIGIELHRRANVPAWTSIPVEVILATAAPSRTSVAGIQRPRDDLHALLMALHGWKGGFTRLRDLFDALLLATTSPVPVEETATELGLLRLWRWTVRLAEAEIFGSASPVTRSVARAVLPRRVGIADRTRARVLAPYLVANPVRVTRGHLAERRLGRAARRRPSPP